MDATVAPVCSPLNFSCANRSDDLVEHCNKLAEKTGLDEESANVVLGDRLEVENAHRSVEGDAYEVNLAARVPFRVPIKCEKVNEHR